MGFLINVAVGERYDRLFYSVLKMSAKQCDAEPVTKLQSSSGILQFVVRNVSYLSLIRFLNVSSYNFFL